MHKVGSIDYIMRYNLSNVTIATNKRLEDCSILVAGCLATREAILLVIQKCVSRIIIYSDSQLVVTSINRKIGVPKDVVNLVEDVNVC